MIENLKAEITKIEKRRKARAEADEKDRKELTRLRDKLQGAESRAALRALIGVPGGVTLSYRCRAELRGETATIKEVRRTRASVDVAGEEWDIPFELLLVTETDRFLDEMSEDINKKISPL